mmetsp:Transcript_21666/g.48320  ORF Transcript_21666/g.48320 Transcript_21666/m.48320 type:complete len:210 (+) Transcript_21666:91-720(+)
MREMAVVARWRAHLALDGLGRRVGLLGRIRVRRLAVSGTLGRGAGPLQAKEEARASDAHGQEDAALQQMVPAQVARADDHGSHHERGQANQARERGVRARASAPPPGHPGQMQASLEDARPNQEAVRQRANEEGRALALRQRLTVRAHQTLHLHEEERRGAEERLGICRVQASHDQLHPRRNGATHVVVEAPLAAVPVVPDAVHDELPV